MRGFIIAGEGSLLCAPNAGQWRFFGNYTKAAAEPGLTRGWDESCCDL